MVATLLLRGVNLLLNVLLISHLWAWFVVPFGLPYISWAHAYGIDLLLSYIVMVSSDNMLTVEESHPWFDGMRKSAKDISLYTEMHLRTIVVKVIFFFCGWAAHWMMVWGW